MGASWEEKEVRRILKENGAVLERTKKHKCYRFPDGRIWVTSSSPSNSCAWKNNLTELRTHLGLNGTRGEIGERRPRKKRSETVKSPLTYEAITTTPRDLASQLAGLVISGSSSQGMSSSPVLDAERSPSKTEVVGSTPTSPTSVWWKPWTWKIFRGLSGSAGSAQ